MAKTSFSTQNFIPIEDIRDGVVILKNGGLRMVLMVSSINFALKSADEQTAILLQFQNMLNSLEFSVQICVQSYRLDINPYLKTLAERINLQENELIKIQTREYINFIKNFTDSVNIMSKTFFIVVPYTPVKINIPKKGFLKNLLGKNDSNKEDDGDFEEKKLQLEQRAVLVEEGLAATGLRAARLGTEELIELFYKTFNPGDNARLAN